MSNLTVSNGLSVRQPPGSKRLPDNDQWTNRFEIRSESSNRLYTVAQNKANGLWGCSCPGYLSQRKCKHLIDGCGLPESKINGRLQMVEKKREKMGY
jgi:hypothetical protein